MQLRAPETLDIGPEVPLQHIQGPGTVLHAGTRLRGARLMILPGAEIGAEAPATVQDCAVGPGVSLAGGFFADAVFLPGVKVGSGAQVRGGTLLEEQASAAHAVGLKQTVLLPFVTLGSLINFCDVLMAGGTSRKDHSEVGSSFIHFNFTPFGRSGDKATPSLVGDVPRGVMLRSPRIFLGGQGGLVGPMVIDYNTVLAAGFVYRKDHGPDELVIGEKLSPGVLPFSPRRYHRIRQRVQRNLRYIGNLVALWHWYTQVRLPLLGQDDPLGALYLRAREVLAQGIAERITRLGQVADYMQDSIAELTREGGATQELQDQQALARQWPALAAALASFTELGCLAGPSFEAFSAGLEQVAYEDQPYLERIRALDRGTVQSGTCWLQEVVDRVLGLYG